MRGYLAIDDANWRILYVEAGVPKEVDLKCFTASTVAPYASVSRLGFRPKTFKLLRQAISSQQVRLAFSYN